MTTTGMGTPLMWSAQQTVQTGLSQWTVLITQYYIRQMWVMKGQIALLTLLMTGMAGQIRQRSMSGSVICRQLNVQRARLWRMMLMFQTRLQVQKILIWRLPHSVQSHFLLKLEMMSVHAKFFLSRVVDCVELPSSLKMGKCFILHGITAQIMNGRIRWPLREWLRPKRLMPQHLSLMPIVAQLKLILMVCQVEHFLV